MSACTRNDCGIDTTPRVGEWEFYIATKDVWKAAGMPTSTVTDNEFDGNYLCVGCSELRSGAGLLR